MVRCLKELVAIPGIFEDAPSKGAPFGKNIQKSLEYVLRMGQQMGFQVKNYDGYAGEITAGEGNRMIGILCHTDVVSAGEGWNTDPFDPVEKDGKLYGREMCIRDRHRQQSLRRTPKQNFILLQG